MAQTRSLPAHLHCVGPARRSNPAGPRAARGRGGRTLPRIPPGLPRSPAARGRGDLPAFSSSFRTASSWPPAAAIRITASSTAASKSSSPFWTLRCRSGAHAIDIEIETAEAAPDRLNQFRGRAQVIVSYHNFEATPPMDTVINRVMKVPGGRVQDRHHGPQAVRQRARAGGREGAAQETADRPGDGRTGLSHARALSRLRRRLHVCRARCAPKAPPPDR